MDNEQHILATGPAKALNKIYKLFEQNFQESHSIAPGD